MIHRINGRRSDRTGKNQSGNKLPGADLLARMNSLVLITEKAGELVVKFLSKKVKIDLSKWFCKQCFYDWPPDSEDPPDRCANVRGYNNEQGEFVPKCGKRTWDRWPDDFDPATCKSKKALTVYYQELAQVEEEDRARRVVNE